MSFADPFLNKGNVVEYTSGNQLEEDDGFQIELK